MPRRYLILILLALALLAALILIPASKDKATATLKIGDAAISVERAITSEQHERGLSYRASLGADQGMLFVYQEDVTPGFWMKGMNFPLDLVWLDQNLVIVDFDKNISPTTYPAAFYPSAPIRYVLEVNAGFVDKHGLKVGDKAYN
jgi:uncharacterized protein